MRVVVGLVLLLLFLPATAPAMPAPPLTPPILRAFDAEADPLAAPPAALAEQLTQAVAARDRETLLRLSLSSLGAAAFVASEDEPVATLTLVAVDSGDFTGDGLADALLLELQPARAMHAVSGLDGSPLWSLPLSSAAGGLVVNDQTGDGRDDVLLLRQSVGTWGESRTCTATRCDTQFSVVWTWSVGLLSGSSGASVWDESFEAGLWEIFEEPLVGPTTHRIRTMNFPLLDVLDGSLAMNLVEAEWSRTVVSVPVAYAAPETLRSNTTASLRALADGSLRVERASAGVDGVAMLHLLGALGGDAAPDAVWELPDVVRVPEACVPLCTPGNVARVSWEAIDGASGATLWSRGHVADGEPVATSRAGDVDGDGVDDWLWTTLHFLSADTHLVSGATGDFLWKRYGWVAAPMGEGIVAIARSAPGAVRGIEFERVDSDGQTKLRTSHLRPANATFAQIDFDLAAGDADGDGIGDIIVNTFACDCEGGTATWAGSVALVESGATGAVILRDATEGYPYYVASDDLDADGRVDVFRYTSVAGVHRFTVGDVDGWRWHVDLEGWLFVFAWLPAADMDGDGAGDVLLSAGTWSGTTISKRVSALGGPDGVARWTLGEPSQV